VYSSFQLAKKYLRYYLTASNSKGHGMHSPFVFDFILQVLRNKSQFQPPEELEELRKTLLNDQSPVEVVDLGAGSRTKADSRRTVAQLAKAALKPPKYAQLLYRLVRHYKPRTMVELGTSLGLTTAYLSAANPEAQIFTIEGSPEIASKAVANFQKLGCENINLLEGNFDDRLPELLRTLDRVDLAYVDGNHRKEPTSAILSSCWKSGARQYFHF
jgi:predicted O-methyltransferase YrrM